MKKHLYIALIVMYFRMFHLHIEAKIGLSASIVLAIFRFYSKNGIPFLIKTFKPNCGAKTLYLYYLS